MKTRSIKELLIIVRDNLDKYITLVNPFGICFVIDMLYDDDLIDEQEWGVLNYFLKKHRIKKMYNKYYWWSGGDIEPRRRWLNKQIEKL